MYNKKRSPLSKGITVIEVIISLAILTIISAIAFPQFTRYRAVSTLKGFSDEFSHCLKLAKETARAQEGSEVELTRNSFVSNPAGSPIFYDYMEIKLNDGRTVRKLNIPGIISITGIPSSDKFIFLPDGTVENNLTISIYSSGTTMYGRIQVSKETGSIHTEFFETGRN